MTLVRTWIVMTVALLLVSFAHVERAYAKKCSWADETTDLATGAVQRHTRNRLAHMWFIRFEEKSGKRFIAIEHAFYGAYNQELAPGQQWVGQFEDGTILKLASVEPSPPKAYVYGTIMTDYMFRFEATDEALQLFATQPLVRFQMDLVNGMEEAEPDKGERKDTMFAAGCVLGLN